MFSNSWADSLKLPHCSLILIKILIFCHACPPFFSLPFCSSILLSKCSVCVCHMLSPLLFLSHNASRPLSWLLLPTSFSFFHSLHRPLISGWKLSWCVSSSSISFFLNLVFIFHRQICFHLSTFFSFLLMCCLPASSHSCCFLLYLLTSLSLKVWQASRKAVCSYFFICLQGNIRLCCGNIIHKSRKTLKLLLKWKKISVSMWKWACQSEREGQIERIWDWNKSGAVFSQTVTLGCYVCRDLWGEIAW